MNEIISIKKKNKNLTNFFYVITQKIFHNKKIKNKNSFIYFLQSAEPKILETYSKLTMKDAMDIMRRNPSTVGQLSNTESMSALFRNYTGTFAGRLGTSSLIQTW